MPALRGPLGMNPYTRRPMNATAQPPLLLTSKNGGVLRLTMNRGAARNALSLGLMQALVDALEAGAKDKDVRVVVIAADGPAFSSGHDLKEMTARRADADKGRAFFEQTFALCSKLMQTVVRHPK